MVGLKKGISIVGGTIFDGTGRTIKNGRIHIDGKMITSIEATNSSDSENETIIKAEGMTVLPGMIDCHVHLASDPTELNWQLAFLKQPLISPPMLSLFAYRNAIDCLEAGFTTLRNIENPGESVGVSLKRAIDMGVLRGPRLITSGTITATGSSIDFDKPVSLPRLRGELADGEDQVRREVRERLRSGVDFIKIFASGGIMESRKNIRRNYTPREVAAIVEESHAHGMRVAAHAEGPEGIQMVLDAGVDSVEHGFYLSEENIRSIISNGTYLVPTLSFLVRLGQGEVQGAEPIVVEKAKRIIEALSKYFPQCVKAGAKIAMGTDTWRELSAVKFGGNAYELEQMVRFGMTESQALISTTKVAAELLGLLDQIGTLEPGKLADIVIVKGNPLQDITILQQKDAITCVIKDGCIVSSRAQ